MLLYYKNDKIALFKTQINSTFSVSCQGILDNDALFRLSI